MTTQEKRRETLYRDILFDLDGTLTDPWEGITRCVQHALAHFGIEEPQDNLTTFIGPPLRESFQARYGMSAEEAETAVEVYRERFSSIGLYENRLFPEVPALLAHLKDRGARLALATSKPEEFARIILDHFGVSAYFDFIVGASMDAKRMTKDAVIAEALRQMGYNEAALAKRAADRAETLSHDERTEGIVMVGDREHDIEGARVFGIPCIGVTWGYAPAGEFETARPAAIATTFADLEALLDDDAEATTNNSGSPVLASAGDGRDQAR